MNNKEILQEAFFKKESYLEKRARKMAKYSYEPINSDSENPSGAGLGSLNKPNNFFAVTNTDEAKKRLVGSFGATIGNNTIKSMASRSIKSFPIIVSDDIAPENVIMVKELLEAQYADYVNLLISNKVVDISAFQADPNNGNIAIQALDSISGNEFGKQRIARKARTGTITADDLFKNFSLYDLVRQESTDYKTGNPFMDFLLEDAIVLPKGKENDLVTFLEEHIDEVIPLNEAPSLRDPENRNIGNRDSWYKKSPDKNGTKNKYMSLDQASSELLKGNGQNAQNKQTAIDTTLGLDATDYGKENLGDVKGRLTNTTVLIDREKFKAATDRTVGEMLMQDGNEYLRNRFEKAAFLLNANYISGGEFIDYVTMRLGIPVPKDIRRKLVEEFKTLNVIDFDNSNNTLGDTARGKIFANRILENRRVSTPCLRRILSIRCREVLRGIVFGAGGGGIGTGVGAGVGALIAKSLGTTAAPFFSNPIGLGILIGSAVGIGAGVLLSLIGRRRRADRATTKFRIEGWERVEMLIDYLDKQRTELYAKNNKDAEAILDNGKNVENYINSFEGSNLKEKLNGIEGDLLKKDFEDQFSTYTKGLESIYEEASLLTSENRININEYVVNISQSTQLICEEILEEIAKIPEVRAEYMAHSLLEGFRVSKTPTQIMPTKVVKIKKDEDAFVIPTFSARSTYAYGSVEYDKRDLKDRRYNEPLIMKIAFRERLSDGNFSDNELVAVIGILGIVTRVPSDEMKYILESNAEGSTIKGMLKGSKNMNDIASDIIGMGKIKKDIEKLPQSADVWNNLEKVARLAVANKLAGKSTDNVANAHLVFSIKEIDKVKADKGVDYLRDIGLTADLMKRYSAFTLMVADDLSERVYIFDDLDNISWDVVPYASLRGKDSSDQLVSALTKLGRI